MRPRRTALDYSEIKIQLLFDDRFPAPNMKQSWNVAPTDPMLTAVRDPEADTWPRSFLASEWRDAGVVWNVACALTRIGDAARIRAPSVIGHRCSFGLIDACKPAEIAAAATSYSPVRGAIRN